MARQLIFPTRAACLLAAAVLLATPLVGRSDAGQSAAEAQAMQNYEAATLAGEHAEATRYILEYMETYEGESLPLTVSLTQRYGNLLLKEGELREGIDVLKLARKRAIAAYGEFAMELFTINLDLGEAYVDRGIGIGRSQQYFDDALKVLRENGQHETELYIKTLVGISSRLAEAGALDGALSTDFAGVNRVAGAADRGGNPVGPGESLTGSGLSSVSSAYGSGYPILASYLDEAAELVQTVRVEDPYLSAKIAIVQAKTEVLETLYLEVVPVSIRGSVTGDKVREKYGSADSNLASAIELLSRDATLNAQYLEIANSARLDVAWLSKDMQRMTALCENDTLNMASRYSSDRLYDIEADGSVVAPRFPFLISTNIFRRLQQPNVDGRGPNRLDRERRPEFIPVCINGRLMAALINSPKVSIEEID